MDGFTIGVPPLDRDMRYSFNGTDLVIDHVNVRDAGKYTCLVTSPHGMERVSAQLHIRGEFKGGVMVVVVVRRLRKRRKEEW